MFKINSTLIQRVCIVQPTCAKLARFAGTCCTPNFSPMPRVLVIDSLTYIHSHTYAQTHPPHSLPLSTWPTCPSACAEVLHPHGRAAACGPSRHPGRRAGAGACRRRGRGGCTCASGPEWQQQRRAGFAIGRCGSTCTSRAGDCPAAAAEPS